MEVYWLGIFLLYHVSNLAEISATVPTIKVGTVAWQVKPFLFFNEETNRTEGILKESFDFLTTGCKANGSYVKYLDLQVEYDNVASFDRLLQGQENYTEGNLSNIHPDKNVWIPAIKEYSKETLKRRGLTDRTLFYTPEIVVIVQRKQISLFTKLLKGIEKTQHIVVMSVICAVIFAILIWITERWNNPEFGKSFVFGFGTGLWWAFVTMTTVGYGDIVPRSFVGRIITVVWMIIGLVSASLMTAAVSDVVLGVDYLDLREQKVAAISDSFESHAILNNYKSIIQGYDSYEDVMNAVRDGDVFAGIITSDIAGYLANELHVKELAIPFKIDIEVPVKLLEPPDMFRKDEEYMKCHTAHLKFRIEQMTRKYRKFVPTETLYIQSLTDFFLNDPTILYYSIAIGVLVVIGLIYDMVICAWIFRKQRHQKIVVKKSGQENGVVIGNNNTELIELQQNGIKDNPSKNGEIQKMRQDIAMIKENIVKINAMSKYKKTCNICAWQR